MVSMADRLYLQVPPLCQGCWRFSGIVVSLVAQLQQSPAAAVHDVFCFSVSHNVPNLPMLFLFFEWTQSDAVGNSSGLAASSSSIVSC